MAYRLSRRSRKEREGVHPDLHQFVDYLLEVSPIDFGVHDGLRQQSEQAAFVRSGASRTMHSRHLKGNDGFGHAVDLVPYIAGKLRWEWEPIYELALAAHKVSEAIEVPIRWGGVWDRRLGNLDPYYGMEVHVEEYVERRLERYPDKKVFLDGPHFELPKIKCYR